MREAKRALIEKFELEKLKYDFMGYKYSDVEDLSFHHLIFSNSFCTSEGIEDKGYTECNGVILKRDTSHDYLHIVERYDLDMFYAITSEMLDEKIKGYLDFYNFKKIDDILNNFECEYSGKTNKKGTPIIKEEYTRRLVKR